MPKAKGEDQERKTKERGNGRGTVTELPSGKCRWRLRDGVGRVLASGTEANKTAAEKVLAAAITSRERGTLASPNRVTVGEWLDSWLENRSPRLAPKTISSYQGLIRKHLKPGLGKKKLQALKPADLHVFYSELEKAGLSGRTRTYVHGLLYSALRDAVRLEVLARNVAEVVRPEVTATNRNVRAAQAWSAEEAGRFLEVARADRLYGLFYVLLALGLRRGEALGLRWSKLDLERRSLNVCETLVSLNGKAIASSPKTSRSRRTLRLPAEVVSVLEAHRDTQAFERRAMGLDPAARGAHVFTTLKGTPVHPDNVGRTLERLARLAGVRVVRVHDLRHTYASLARRHGVSLEIVSEKLGHARPSFTADVYRHTFEDEHDAGAVNLSELLAAHPRVPA